MKWKQDSPHSAENCWIYGFLATHSNPYGHYKASTFLWRNLWFLLFSMQDLHLLGNKISVISVCRYSKLLQTGDSLNSRTIEGTIHSLIRIRTTLRSVWEAKKLCTHRDGTFWMWELITSEPLRHSLVSAVVQKIFRAKGTNAWLKNYLVFFPIFLPFLGHLKR
jgi:hypothetical protein